jgi:exosome complex component RRP43
VRAEILNAKNIPDPPTEDEDAEERLRRLGLIVLNVEFATGSAKKWLPGGAPPTLAQSTAWKLQEMILSFGLIDIRQLEIRGAPPSSLRSSTPSSSEDEESHSNQDQVLAYWTLYIDVTLISHATSPLPTLWAAILGALRTTRLPHAFFSPAYDTILCSSTRDPRKLNIRGMPIGSTFRVFDSSDHKGLAGKEDGKGRWLLAEPDDLEEEICGESMMVVVDCSDVKRGTRLMRVEKGGGGVVGWKQMVGEVVGLAEKRWAEWNAVLEDLGDEN